MAIKSDKWIIENAQENQLINPFESKQIREVEGEKLFHMVSLVMDMTLGAQMNSKFLLILILP
ncbi:MAG: hypothetical protein CM15mP31_3000 [Gammaproteobacteria bacterium]|nr:MAG: hypothetical protein CM15mP31_3000 [Gammaproteobacteria bacterium]